MPDLERIPEMWRRSAVTIRDLPLALLLAAAALVPAFQGYGTRLGDTPSRPIDAFALGVITLECLPLVVRRRWPAVCIALVALGFAIEQLTGYHTLAGTALPIALLSAGLHLQRHRLVTVILLTAAYVPLAVALGRAGSTERLGGFLTFYLALAFIWGLGAWLRRSRATELERRRHIAEITRTTERTRIARDLHDIVTHHVTAMVVQAEAARYLTAAPERLDQTLTAITDTGRRAISDLRHLLELLNPDHNSSAAAPPVGAATASVSTPTPFAGEFRTLVEQTRQAGQPVEFTEQGQPAQTSGGAELTAYRVVQEALTNALKHAYGSRTEVHVHHGEREITVQVSTDGSGSRTGPSGGSGHRSAGGSGRGLAGLRERVAVLDGEFSADRQPDGGFVVRARIPVGGTA